MKRLLLILLFLAASCNVFADCAIASDGIVQQAQSEFFLESEGLVWVGEPIEEIVDNDNFVRMIRMKVIEVWCGEIIKTPDAGSPAWASNFLNTDDEVFIFSPFGTSQDFSIAEGRYVIVSAWFGSFYSVSNCLNDLFPIDTTDNSVSGNIHGNNTFETIALDELKNEILGQTSCVNGLGIEQAPFEINVFPNPTNGYFQVQLASSVYSVNTNIRSIDGRLLSRQVEDSPNFSLDISDLEAGIYIIDLLIDDQYLYRQELVKL